MIFEISRTVARFVPGELSFGDGSALYNGTGRYPPRAAIIPVLTPSAPGRSITIAKSLSRGKTISGISSGSHGAEVSRSSMHANNTGLTQSDQTTPRGAQTSKISCLVIFV